MIHPEEVMETLNMLQSQKLDIRTITMGISLRGCSGGSVHDVGRKIFDRIVNKAERLVKVGEDIEREYGIPIVNKRVSVTPIALIAEGFSPDEMVVLGKYVDRAAEEVGVNFIGGFSALVHKGFTQGDLALIHAIPRTLAGTERVCASVNVGTTKAGINMDAVSLMGRVIKETAELTRHRDGIGCAKIVVFCNAPEDNPFMAGAFHGIGEPDASINIGISGPGVVLHVVREHPEADLGTLANLIKNTAFKITRMGELVGRNNFV